MPRPSAPPALRRSVAPPLRPSGPPASARGFALLITITLVAFLVLVLVTLATLTRVETQVATNSQLQAQARQNALMALNIAIGQLQRHTGPDQRVTAPADLQPVAIGASVDPISSTNLGTGATDTILESIDDYWRSSRNRRWVGVWRDPDPERTTMNPDAPADTPVSPQLQAWLVSGNEATGTNFTPQTQVANLTLEGVNSPSAPIATFGTATTPHRLLVGRGTTSITTADEVDRAVAVPEIPITSSAIPGQSGPQTVGHYAWWIGDEGIKARANMIDPNANSLDPEENRTRLQSARRNAIETMTDLSSLYPANDPDLPKVLSGNQLAHSNNDPDFRAELANRYHDITVYSRGVLSDTRNGGLKADLSWMLGQSSETDYRDQLRELYGDSSIALTDSILSNFATPHISALGENSFIDNYALGLSRSATWGQLRSFFNMGNTPDNAVPGVIESSGKARSRIQHADVQGINPLLVHAKMFFGLQVDAGGAITVQMRPLIVLANPYDITLTGSYWVRFEGPSVTVRTGAFDATNPVPAAPTDGDLSKFDTTEFTLSGSHYNRLVFHIPVSEIPPGKTRIYCLAQNDSGTGTAYQQIELEEGYNDGPIFRLLTGKSLGSNTHAAIYAEKIVPGARLFGADPSSNAGSEPDKHLLQYQYPYGLKDTDVDSPDGGKVFVVYPVAAGETKAGGGGWFVIPDSISEFPQRPQQAYFLQYNPRTMTGYYTSFTSNPHPLELAQTYLRNGESGNDAWFTADLMFDNMTGDSVRWGPVTKARSGNRLSGSPPPGVGDDTGFTNILYSIPRPDHALSSIPQLQHFSPSGFINNGRFGSSFAERFSTLANTFQVNYPTGNSYPNPRVPRDRAYVATTSNSGRTNVAVAYDGSWLYNEVLADRFFFSSYPALQPFDFTDDELINRPLKPFRNQAAAAWDSPSNFRGTPRRAAVNLLADGAFNINSTSVEAWKAILSSLRNVPVGGDTSVEVPFSRGLYQTEGYTGARSANTAGAWAGFHNLSDDEIEDIAKELVLQIRRRGPFLSLADFMNRRLIAPANDPLDLGLSGALQAAIDAILNQADDVDPVFRVQSQQTSLAENDYLARTMTAGSPGYVLQADVLSPLASTLAPRSDTFVIRTYGDVENPATGEVTARAWCEAIVQRTPDYVMDASGGGNDPEEIPAAGSENETFGRRYQLVSFRWLSPEEI